MESILRAVVGIAFFLAVAWLLSNNKRKLNVRIIVGGLLLQIVLAFVILKTDPGRKSLESVSNGVAKFLSMSNKGAEFVFGPVTQWRYTTDEKGVPDGNQPIEMYPHFLYDRGLDHLSEEQRGNATEEARSDGNQWGITFAFRALPTIIFFSAVMAVLYYLGIIQVVVSVMARFMMWAMRVSGSESLSMAANVFVGQTEAPLVVKPYIKGMTDSEVMALMTGGFATIAESVLAAYIGFLGSDYAGHLLAASFMSAPAAFVLAKIMVPETEESETQGKAKLDLPRNGANLLDAVAGGTTDGLRLALNVGAMLIAFIALMALIDWPLSAITVGEDPLSLQRIFGWVFSPVAWLMGVPWDDCALFGSLLGTKIGVNEFVAFATLGDVGPQMSEKARIMGAYALCGFANFASIGIQIGGISALVPDRRKDLARLALRAMLAGAMASWMTATIAGAFIG